MEEYLRQIYKEPHLTACRVKRVLVTYIVVEGLCLTGVLACLPSVWSCTVQIPEYAEIEWGEVRNGKVKGYQTEQ